MKVSDVMTSNLVAARASTTAREIGTKLVIGNFKWYNSIVWFPRISNQWRIHKSNRYSYS